MLDDGQPQSGSAQLPGASLVHTVETLENSRQIMLGYANAGIGYFKLDLVTLCLPADMRISPPSGVYFSALSTRLSIICRSASSSAHTVTCPAPLSCPLFDATRFWRRASAVGEPLQASVDHGRDGNVLKVKQLVARFDAGQAQQVENQAVQAVALLRDTFEKGAAVLGIPPWPRPGAFPRKS